MKKNPKRNSFLWEALVWGSLIFIASIIICFLVYQICVIIGVSKKFEIIFILLEGTVGALTGGFIIPQLKGARDVEQQENEIHMVEFYHTFITYWLESDKMFIEHPEIRKYFYSDTDMNHLEPDSNEYQLVMAFAEYFDDLFRYSPSEIIKQMSSFSVIPEDQIKSYINYMRIIMNRPAFKRYVAENRENINFNSDIENNEIALLEKAIMTNNK